MPLTAPPPPPIPYPSPRLPPWRPTGVAQALKKAIGIDALRPLMASMNPMEMMGQHYDRCVPRVGGRAC